MSGRSLRDRAQWLLGAFALAVSVCLALASVAAADTGASGKSQTTVKAATQAATGGSSAAADQYGSAEKGEKVVKTKSKTAKTEVAGATAASQQKPSAGGTLPFTGASLGWVMLAGALLLSAGVVLRTRGRRG